MYEGWSASARSPQGMCSDGYLHAGREHPEPKYILSIAIHKDTMYALSFTEGGMAASGAGADAAADAALGGAHAVEANSAGDSVGASLDERPTAEGSVLEVHALDLQQWRWRKVEAQVQTSPMAATLHCNACIFWLSLH
jgi:hypothetical protein